MLYSFQETKLLIKAILLPRFGTLAVREGNAIAHCKFLLQFRRSLSSWIHRHNAIDTLCTAIVLMIFAVFACALPASVSHS